jgi:hypothetical protein
MLRFYSANSTNNPLGWKPWNSRLQQLGAYYDAKFSVPTTDDINWASMRMGADFPNFAASRPGRFRSRDFRGAPVPRNYAPPELIRAGMGWLGQDQIALNPTIRVTDTGTPVPFDTAQIAPNQGGGYVTIPEQANPPTWTPDQGVIVATPRTVCPAWGCGFVPPPVSFNPNVPTLNPPPVIAPAGSPAPTVMGSGRLAQLFQQWQANQNAATLAAQQAATTTAAAATAVNTQLPAVAAAPVSTDYVSEVESWLTQQTLINGIPNWAIGAGVVAALLMVHKKSGR